jgi:hypothetical protein
LIATLTAAVNRDTGLIETRRMALNDFHNPAMQLSTRHTKDFDRIVFTGEFNFRGLLFGHKSGTNSRIGQAEK